MTRTFRVVHVAAPGQNYKSKDFENGTFIGTPFRAAKKAFSQLCRAKKIKGQCTLTITMQEKTRGSDRNVMSYRLKREKLKEPKVLEYPDGRKVTIKYKIKKMKLSQNSNAVKQTAGRGRPTSKYVKPSEVLNSLKS